MAAKGRNTDKKPHVEPPSVTGGRNAASALTELQWGPLMWRLLSRVAAPSPGSGRETACGCAGILGLGRWRGQRPRPRASLPGDGGLSEWSGVTGVPSGCGHNPSTRLPLCRELAAGTAHLPFPSPASCCAFQVAGDKINSPNWRLWLAALGERG